MSWGVDLEESDVEDAVLLEEEEGGGLVGL